jgi:hypothetical protein
MNIIKEAAEKLISSLLTPGTNDPNHQMNVQAKIALAQIALVTPLAIIGTCTVGGCNTDMHFVGRADGLYVCCSGSPKHCWKI